MQSMIEIDGRIVTTDILTESFCCDLAACKGICCVEGNSGAPLEGEEGEILEREYEAYRSYMTAAGIEAVERQGFVVIDIDGDETTPLVDDAECAFAFAEDGITFCAIEKAHRDGRTDFVKPVSCHLYPIRVKKFRDGSVGLNYHRWSVCAPAVKCGHEKDIKVYQSLKGPIERAFGEEFYFALDAAAGFLKETGE